jgi:hypothetical protein
VKIFGPTSNATAAKSVGEVSELCLVQTAHIPSHERIRSVDRLVGERPACLLGMISEGFAEIMEVQLVSGFT